MRSRGWTGWGCEDMKRTALYLDDQLWNSLHFRASAQGASISELVREAVRERYFGNLEERKEAMQAFIGIRKERADAPDSTTSAPCAAAPALTGLAEGASPRRFRYPHRGCPRQRPRDRVQMDDAEPIRCRRPILARQRRRAMGRRAAGRTPGARQPLPRLVLCAPGCRREAAGRRLPESSTGKAAASNLATR